MIRNNKHAYLTHHSKRMDEDKQAVDKWEVSSTILQVRGHWVQLLLEFCLAVHQQEAANPD
jgi:hypothetical protein